MKKAVITISFICIVFFSFFAYYALKSEAVPKENESLVDNKIQQEEEKKEGKIDNQLNVQKDNNQNNNINTTPNATQNTTDYSKANENGKIMILMYHKFANVSNDVWTRTFDDFEKDLETLYNKGYRPISLTDYVNGNIDVPAGLTPVVLTFDNGYPSQLKFEKIDGELVVDVDTAVNIMKEFNKKHPDFELTGTFYISATNFFGGTGTFGQRLKYITDLGFEIGNMTKSYYYLNNAKSADKVQEEIGGFVKFIDEYLPGYVVDSLSLPGGGRTKTYEEYMTNGEYDGMKYGNKSIVSIYNSFPAKSPIDKELKLTNLPRIKANDEKEGIDYWIKYFDEHPEERYISDGDASTFRINETDKENVTNKYNVVVK